ncbi:MAG TPA: methyltransferase domain-containing protein [Pseudonocardiaceae bacterium]|nr:methyltransferase domain-containing protein [Pseudonocardiaceae bacterium]
MANQRGAARGGRCAGSGARCLDLGCGGGHVTVELAGLIGLTGSVVGVDIDAEIVDLARAVAAARGLGNLKFRVGTAEDLGEAL